MKNIYLLDTNIISQVTKPEPNEKLITNLDFHSGTCAISSITWFELLNGVALLPESKKKEKLTTFLYDYVQSSFDIIPYDSHAAFINSEITSQLIPQGKPTPILDTQIASIAIANNLILVTENFKDFEIFTEQFNLMVENWVE
ncbi:MAG: type II toxin-antitoxin system VapC family toxin [Spirochaetaceae bacterium]|nr:type II toxin-antitoxin system VapC family toxin [Spirochaetaceae bacterium]